MSCFGNARDVAGVEPPAFERLCRRLRVVPVAHHHVRAAREEFAVLRDADLDVRDDLAHRAGHVVIQRVGCDHRARLGHAIALDQRQAEADEDPRNVGRQRRTAGPGRAQPPAQFGEHLVGDQFFKDRPKEERRLPRPAALLVFETRVSDLHRAVEELALAFRGFVQLRLYRRPDALVDARDRMEDGGPHTLQVLAQQRDRARIGGLEPDHHPHVIADVALEHMRQRQEGEEFIVLGNLRTRQRIAAVGKQVVVRQHHALGPAGGAARVDDRGEALRVVRDVTVDAGFRQPFGHRLHPRIAEGRARGVQHQDALHAREVDLQHAKLVPLLLRIEQHQPRAAVGEDVGDVVRAVDGVERHGDEALAVGRLVEHHPFGGVALHQRDAVAGIQALLREPGLPAADSRIHLGPGARAPAAGVGVEVDVGGAVRGALRALTEQAVKGFCVLIADPARACAHAVSRRVLVFLLARVV